MEVKEIKVAIKKLESSKDDKEILKTLVMLREKVKPTEQLLRETKVGVIVNKFRTSSDAEISKEVKTIIRKWKEEVKKGKQKKPEPAPAEPKKPSKIYSGVRNAKSDGVDTAIYDSGIRNNSLVALYNGLVKKNTVNSPHEVFEVAKQIESEVFKMFKNHANDDYRSKIRSLFMNINSSNNPELRAKLLSNKIVPSKLVTMSPEEMANENLKKELEQLQEENLFKAKSAEEKRAITDSFICGKCKQRKVTYYQMQTRSADEPLTTFCTCVNCGNHWTFS